MAAMGKHDEAFRSYSIALQLSKNTSSKALSRRASSHVKLENWAAAYKVKIFSRAHPKNIYKSQPAAAAGVLHRQQK